MVLEWSKDHGLFINLTLKKKEVKAKIKKKDYTKLKSSCTAKNNTNKTKGNQRKCTKLIVSLYPHDLILT